ncbi:hypothetical protein BegalDRAFT_0059 [Beggiatoa alba B18LD]|uniref:GAF domain-containing protein n=1 Tax=Beggiatoa alba B18LD TaxID=395493 RepID=I3CBJ2_9GAMM|nr:GAF domain-containing protein [Beggiatoa alba]EIJ40985.1 hypothetical protein BegalDRAFT_0059 [Beggiatoa alba B18LD]
MMNIRLSTLNISALILLGFMVILLSSSVLYMQQTLQEKEHTLQQQTRFKQLTVDFINTTDYLINEARKFIITYDIQHLQNYYEETFFTQTRENILGNIKTWANNTEELELLNKVQSNLHLLQTEDIHAMRLVLAGLNIPTAGVPEEISNYPLTEGEQLAEPSEKLHIARILLFSNQYTFLEQKTIEPIRRFQLFINQRVAQNITQAQVKVERAVISLVVSAVLIPASVLILLFIFWKQISLPIADYITTLKQHDNKSSNFALKPEGIRELRVLADVFNQQLRKNHEQLQKNHELMQESQKTNRMLIKQDWLKTGQTQLQNLLIGLQNETIAARHILQFFLHYLDIQSGLFYINTFQKPPTFKLIASEGILIRQQLGSMVNLGEGLIGQVGLEQKLIFLSQPMKIDEFIAEELRNAMPNYFLAIPFFYEKQLKGIIALGTTVEFNELQLEFLEQIMPSIGIFFHTIQTNMQLQAMNQKG